jgi:protein tyrosine/serine phosphatase
MRTPFSTLRRALFLAVIALGLTALSLGSWALGLRLSGNIHAVDEGKIFRSAQLSPDHLKALIRDEGIKTIINLRGENPQEGWYRAEVEASTNLGVHYVSLPLSANEEPDDATLKVLIDTMQKATYPALIHCEGGADRSGLASALYRLVILGDAPDQAARQLSFRYGHFPWLTSRTGAMDRAFWRVVNAPDRFKRAE